jgi:hypothetical protein
MEHFFYENRLPVITNFQEPWADMCKRFKDTDYKPVIKLEKKLQQYFQTIVKVYLPKDVLAMCQTP